MNANIMKYALKGHWRWYMYNVISRIDWRIVVAYGELNSFPIQFLNLKLMHTADFFLSVNKFLISQKYMMKKSYIRYLRIF